MKIKRKHKMFGAKVLKTVAVLVMLLIFVNYFFKSDYSSNKNEQSVFYNINNSNHMWGDYVTSALPKHKQLVKTYFDQRQDWKTSNLGSILFKNHRYEEYKIRAKNFTVLIYKHWNWLQNRHLKAFGDKFLDPLTNCSVKNCIFTGDDKLIGEVDAVFVHLQKGVIPKNVNRKPEQIWIFGTDESPRNSFSLSKKPPDISSLANVFNWSMNYRHDADIPVPYGRVLPLKKPLFEDLYDMYLDYSNERVLRSLVPNWRPKIREVAVAVIYSNCLKERQAIIEELSKYVRVDVYGACSNSSLKHSCPGHFKADCMPVSLYMFYLVMENSHCTEYLTEKVFYHAFSKGSVPIIFGPSVADCKKLLPPLSFIHVDNYPSLKELAEELQKMVKNYDTMVTYHQWRNNFEVVNEHGYFGTRSRHFCRICEALNYNDDKQSIYDLARLRSILDYKMNCR